MKKSLLLLFFAFLSTGILYSGGTGETSSPDKPVIAVSILPQKYFAERIIGDSADIMVLVLPGESPATYDPTPEQIKTLAKAKVLFTIGVPFERAFIPKIRSNLPDLPIVDTAEGIEKRYMDGNASADQQTKDPHIWMSPPLVKKQALTMLNALIGIFPGKKEIFSNNYREFAEDLDKIDKKLKETLDPVRGSTLFVYHPSFGYFAERYGLKQRAIETGGKAPGPKTLGNIIEEVKREGVKVIFVQPEFQQHSVSVIAKATGTAVVPIDPLSEDYLTNLERIADILNKSLK